MRLSRNSRQRPPPDAGRPHSAEDQKPGWHEIANFLVQKQLQVFEPYNDIELARTVLALPKGVRDLPNPYETLRRGHQVEQDLEADARSGTNDFFKVVTRQDKKAAHWVADVCMRYPPAEIMSEVTQNHAMPSEVPHTTASSIARSHDDVETLRFELGKHLRQNPLVMLEVGIHNSDVRCGSCHHAFD